MKLEELTDTAIDYIFEHMDAKLLSDWERGFVESTQDRWERVRKMTDRQKEVLGEIWDRQP